MTYTTRNDALEFECPHCGAHVAEKCVGARGKKRDTVHRERITIAAKRLEHPPISTFSLVGDRLIVNDEVIGRLVGGDFEVQLGGEGRTYGEGRGGAVDVDVFGSSEKREKKLSPKGGVLGEGNTQCALLPDPVDEIWGHYQATLDRPKTKLTPKVRRWISDALQAVGIEDCKRAIDGLAASDYHRTNGYVGIEYALRPRMSETIEGRVAKMAAKAPSPGNGSTTIHELVKRLPSETHAMVYEWIRDVEAMLRNPTHRGILATGQGRLAELREKAGIEPVVVEGRIVEWKDVRQ